MIDFCLSYNIKILHINKLAPYGRAKNETTNFSTWDFYQWMDEGYQYITKLYSSAYKKRSPFHFELDVSSDFRSSIYSSGRRYSCGINNNLISVANDGNVFFCPALHNDKLVLGNVYKESLRDIINLSKISKENFSVDSLPKCEMCNVRYFCKGGCRALAFEINSEIRKEDPNCEIYKTRILQLMSQ